MTTHTCPQCNAIGDTYQPICPECGSHMPEPDSRSYSELTMPLSGIPDWQNVADVDEGHWQNKQVAHFKVIELIAKGGFGEVYRARDLKLGREVAIKFLKLGHAPAHSQLANLKHEAIAASALNHPNICTIYELGEVEDQVYIVMELLDGETLKKRLPNKGFELDEFLEIALQVAQGLDEAHRHNLIHRDIKPGNIQITSRNQVKVLDFGLAKWHRAESKTDSTNLSEASSHTMGTLHYMSPEQVMGQAADYRSDIFSLGVVFYQMLSGQLPFKKESFYATMDDIVNLKPTFLTTINPKVPKQLAQMISKMLSKDPEDRFNDLSEVIEQLRAFETQITMPPPRPVWPIVTLSLLPLVLVASLLLWQNLSNRPAVTLAIQPLVYEGPRSEEAFPDALEGLFFQTFQNMKEITTVPLLTSRESDASLSASELAQQLDVGTVLGGSLKLANQRYQTELWLHREGKEEPFWRSEFEGEAGELYTDFRDMVQQVLGAMNLKLPHDDDGLGAKPESITAYQRGIQALDHQYNEVNTEDAYQAFNEALAIDPDFAPAHAGLAMAHWIDFVRNVNVDHVEKASHEANIAISKAPNQPEGYMAAGMVALGRGRTNEAMDLFRKAQDLAPADESIVLRIGDAFSRLNRMEEAEHMYTQAIALRPGFWMCYLKMGRLYFQFNLTDKAAAMFQKVIELNPNSDVGYNNLAAAYMRKGNFNDATPLLEQGLQYNNSSEAYSNLGFIYFSLHQFDDAAKKFQQALDLSPNDPLNHGNHGDALRLAGRTQEARDAYNMAIDLLRKRLRINPRDWQMRAILAMYLGCAGQCEASEDQMALLDGHWNAERHYYAAIASAGCDKAAETKNHIRAALTAGFTADIGTNLDLKPFLDEELRALLEKN